MFKPRKGLVLLSQRGVFERNFASLVRFCRLPQDSERLLGTIRRLCFFAFVLWMLRRFFDLIANSLNIHSRSTRFQLHRLNTNFVWKPRSGPFRRLTPEHVRAYDEFGFFVLEHAFDETTIIEEVATEIDRFEAQLEEHLRTMKNGKDYISRVDEINFTNHLVTQSKRLREFCICELFQDLGHDLIGPDVRLYWDQAVYKKPNTTAPFPWHQDNGYTFVEPQQYLTCWIALTDADEDNGCLWVLPGAHRYGTLRHQRSELGLFCFKSTPKEAVPFPIRAGGIAVFSSLIPHLTGPNNSNYTRKAYVVQFVPDGACRITFDPQGRRVCTNINAPDRQFPILVAGSSPSPLAVKRY